MQQKSADTVCSVEVAPLLALIQPELFISAFSGQDHEQAFSKVVVELRKRYIDACFTHRLFLF